MQEKQIDGLSYMSQGDIAKALGIDRHTVNTIQKRYNLPVVEDEPHKFYCTAVFFSLYCVRQAYRRNKNFPESAAVLVAIGHLPLSESTARTTKLLQKGLNISREKALLNVGVAAEWIRVNLKAECHVKI